MSLTTCDPSGRIIEFDQYITPDGITYNLHAPAVRSVLSDEGLGMPPIEYTTERGPSQHGVSIKDHFLRPRLVQMILRQSGFSRTNRWYNAGELLAMLNPSRTVGWTPGVSVTAPTQGTLRKYMPNGSHLDLKVVIVEGPKFEPRGDKTWDEWGYTETLRFQANDPLLYDPVQKSSMFGSPSVGLLFPTSFPIVFGQLNATVSVTYGGNWDTFPGIVLTGPLTNPRIYNHTTGEFIGFTVTVGSGQTMTIALTYGNKSATLNDGTNMLPFIDDPNDLATFHLACDPVAPGGVNQIQVVGGGTSLASAATLTWYNRYLAIQQI
jgi:hypothetical protein